MQSTLCSERGTAETHEDQGDADVFVVLLHAFGTYRAPPPLATLLRSCHLPLPRLPLVVTDYIRDTYGFIRSPPCMRCNLNPFVSTTARRRQWSGFRCITSGNSGCPARCTVRPPLGAMCGLFQRRNGSRHGNTGAYRRGERGGEVMKLSLLATKSG